MGDFVCPLAAESNKNLSRRLRLEGNDERLPRCELKPITEHQIVGNKGSVFKSPQSGNWEENLPFNRVCACVYVRVSSLLVGSLLQVLLPLKHLNTPPSLQ